MKQTAQENTALLTNAQSRAKDLIENYIKQIGKATGVEYTIHWEYVNNTGSEDQNNPETESSAK